jgi:hypothetical protein
LSTTRSIKVGAGRLQNRPLASRSGSGRFIQARSSTSRSYQRSGDSRLTDPSRQRPTYSGNRCSLVRTLPHPITLSSHWPHIRCPAEITGREPFGATGRPAHIDHAIRPHVFDMPDLTRLRIPHGIASPKERGGWRDLGFRASTVDEWFGHHAISFLATGRVGVLFLELPPPFGLHR